ncbi:MAG: peptidoglycan-binding protein [Peptococcaceae bacterium]|nr:peptidoglycan-binding protein [Peptococcaceae bacterium]
MLRLFILLLCAIFGLSLPAATKPAWAGQKEYIVCPLNCEDIVVISPEQKLVDNEDVRQLQELLTTAGYYTGPINGTYDKLTTDAVRYFQKAHNLKPDAVVGPKTWYTLATAAEPVKANNDPLPPPQGPVEIVIDVRNRTLTIMNNGYPYKQYPCAVGKKDTPSPVGNWKIIRKAAHWGTGFGTRWLGLSVTWGLYGIHGTNKPGSIGSYASHGCIRMFNKHVEEVYPLVKVGTPVYIIGNPLGPYPRPVLCRGDRKSAVLEIQRLMIKHGYYDGPIDGIFGGGMRQAVIEFRKAHGLPHDDRFDAKCYELLGL